MGQLPPYLIRRCSHAKNAPARDLASLAGEPSLFADSAAAKLGSLASSLGALSGAYDAVVANPPYMGAKNMNAWLGGWVKKRYPDVKGDLFSCFIVRNSRMGAEHAQLGFMTPYVWMFIGTYEKLRRFVVEENTITSLIQLEYSGFSGATVPICTFTLQKGCCPGYRGGYVRLSDFVGADQQEPRALQALADPDCGWFYRADARDFKAIPGSPIAYWASKAIYKAFAARNPLSSIGHPRVGIQTGENAKFLRLWWEVGIKKSKFNSTSVEDGISSKATWFPYNKGGEYRKWYGNNDYVINWINDGERIIGGAEKDGRKVMNLPEEVKFKPAVTWSKISSGGIAFRYKPHGHLFDVAGTSIFSNNDNLAYLQGAANSSVMLNIASLLSPTLNFEVGQISSYPILFGSPEQTSAIVEVVLELRHLSQADWDTQETSWDFDRNSLV